MIKSLIKDMLIAIVKLDYDDFIECYKLLKMFLLHKNYRIK